jgi:hypothetical protein
VSNGKKQEQYKTNAQVMINKRLIRPTKNANTLLFSSKLVFIDRANTFQKKEEDKRLKKLKETIDREKRELKIYVIPKEAQRYELFLSLTALWQGCVARLASLGANFEQRLMKADLYGAAFKSK